MKIQPYKIYGKGKFTVIQAFLKKKKKNLKKTPHKTQQPNLPPKTIRKRTTGKT